MTHISFRNYFKLPIFITVLFICSTSIITGCNRSSLPEDERDNYTDMRVVGPVFDERDELAGFLAQARTDICGSDCYEHIYLFSAKGLAPTRITELDGGSLESDFISINNDLYMSEMIWKEGEGHFGCHSYKLKKLRYLEGKLQAIAEEWLPEKFALDSGDAQGQCKVYPGLKNIISKYPPRGYK